MTTPPILSELVCKKAESLMHAWDDDPSNNNRFVDGDDIMPLIKRLAEKLEMTETALKVFTDVYNGESNTDLKEAASWANAALDRLAQLRKFMEET